MPKGASASSGKSAAPKKTQEEAPSQTAEEILESQERKRAASTRSSGDKAPSKERAPAMSTPDAVKEVALASLRLHATRYDPNARGNIETCQNTTPPPKESPR